jgi:hypothetical protein
MAQQEPQSGKTQKSSSSNPGGPEFGVMAKKQFEELAEVQSEFMENIREANQKCLDRMQSEAALASEFVAKLTASHSISDTTTACQEWGKRRMELFTEDGKRLMTDSQKFMEKAARLLSNGWLSNGRTGGST